MTSIEIVLAMIIFLVGTAMLWHTVIGVGRLKHVNRENSVATEAACSLLEVMRNRPFEDVYALYNADPLDDPEGPGTGPGPRFAVAGLRPTEDAVDGLIGTILFPTIDVGSSGSPVLELREDVVLRELGMPRDLNGDWVIDDRDHAADYFRLPVSIRMEWVGQAGRRESTLHTQLCRFEYGS